MRFPSRFIVFAIALQIAFGGGSAFSARAIEADSTRGERLAVFDEVWQTIRDRYYDPNLRGVNWQDEREKLRPLAAAADSQTEFYALLRRLIGSLHDSHTRVFAPDEKSDWHKPQIIGIGVSVREIENELVAVKIEKNSDAEKSGIKVGDVLTQIDGVSAKSFFAQKIAGQIGVSTAAAGRFRAAFRIFDGAAGSTVRIGWRGKDVGGERFADLRRDWQIIVPALRVSRAKNFLVVGFDVFTPEIVREFFQILQRRQSVRGIVIDLRQNRGGEAEAAVDLISAFLPRGTQIGRFINRRGETAIDAKTRESSFFAANFVSIKETPIVILTSPMTASAAEIFAASLKNANRAEVIGATTCGCVLAVKTQRRLPDGGALDVSELDFQMPDGSRLEGAGVLPNESVQTKIQDVRSDRDRQLERALNKLKVKN